MRITLRLLSATLGRPYYISTPIFYVNAAPHLGHAYSAAVADAAARVARLMWPTARVSLTSGTDEHGSKVQRAATAAGIPLPEYCDNVSAMYQEVLTKMDVQYTDFIRTTQDRHKKAVHTFWRELDARGFLYRTHYSGWYSVSDENFVPETQIKEVVRGGQTVRVSVESGQVVEWTEEENHMFRLSEMRLQLLKWLSKEGVVTPSKYQRQLCDQLMDAYLPDISVSRPASRVHWAVPVPNDSSQSVYVWLDALVNYLTATGYPESGARLWPADVHVVGKDILKFHGVYWPAFLLAAGLTPPRQILCHAHWTVDGHKMSKSVGNVVHPLATPGGPEALRYFLLREATMTTDANYSETKLIRVVNSELADSLGNLASRASGPALNPRGQQPPLTPAALATLAATDAGGRLLTALHLLPETCHEHYTHHRYYRAADAIVAVLHAANAFFDAERPWLLRREAAEAGEPATQARLDGVLHVALESVRVAALLLGPLAPAVAARVLDNLAIPESERGWEHASQLSWGSTAAPHAVPARPLASRAVAAFPRIPDPARARRAL